MLIVMRSAWSWLNYISFVYLWSNDYGLLLNLTLKTLTWNVACAWALIYTSILSILIYNFIYISNRLGLMIVGGIILTSFMTYASEHLAMKSFLKGLYDRDIARNGNFCFSCWLIFCKVVSGVNYDTLFHLPLFPFKYSVKVPYTTLVFDPGLDWITKVWRQQSMTLGLRKP